MPATRTSPRRTGTVRRMSEERRDEILQRLENIILAEGFAALTIDEIAGRLQCSKSTLYGVAPSREQLIIKTFERVFRVRAEKIDRQARAAGAPRERIINHINGVRDEMATLSRACYTDMRAFEPADDLYRRNAHASADRLREFIDEGISDGSFRPANAEFLGLAVNLLLEAVLDGTFADRLQLSDADAYVEITTLILHALSAPPR
ncbi:TetR/AcrR family transcriptional regulator [Nocardia sp. NEAU-G5]|uniref:TetR/AcrR family transcriptional regulator n=1 Tax=Nocardia albiluteola TaxID=2842303 RepID=A0ABS6BDB9_9NOCA|nr:TetR/AcrR family transcriptional regulator [Nocardia albiluteola]MBU3067755.1 TetR/AcrR family transcriptional regulator [Nocardia albiluteola]